MSANAWTPEKQLSALANVAGTVKQEKFTTSTGQRVLELQTFTYAPNTGSVLVFKNGDLLSADKYKESFTDKVILSTPALDTDVYVVVGFVAISGVSPVVDSSLIFNIKAYGAKGDGVTDDSAAIQAALNAANLAGGGEVVIPNGVFRKADTSPTLIMYSNTAIRGYGDSSVIFHDDKDTNGRKDLLTADNTNNITFSGFKISGTALTYTNETNQSQTLTGGNINGLRLINVTFEKLRYMATAFNNVKNAIVRGCRLDTVVRDGIRFTNSSNVIVTDNNLYRVTDDSVALHSLDSAVVPGTGFIVANNTFEQCQGIKILGAKTLLVTNNIFQRTLRSPILVSFPDTGSEGNSQQFAVRIVNNTLLDTFGSKGTNYAILVSSAARSKGVLTTQPGVNAPVFDYDYLNDLDAVNSPQVGQYGIQIEGNTVGRTLPLVAAYSSYGYGQMFDRITAGFWSDPAIVAADYQLHGISISGPTKGASISRNHIFGMGTGYNAIWLQGSAGNIIDLDNLLIESNNVFDCPGLGISNSFVGSSSKNIIIRNNIFDLDPYFRAASHAADNTWTSSGSVVGIQLAAGIPGAVVDGNVFKNCGNTVTNTTDLTYMGVNYIYADVNVAGDSTLNKGVRFCSVNNNYVYIIIDGDPTSATYNKLTTIPRSCSSTIPTAGKYVQGHYVRKTTPTVAGVAGSQYTVIGWWRATVGTAHAAGVDWIEQRALTGT